MSLDVSKAMAELFMNQCMGEYCGHMANVPNNPVLFGLCNAHGINDKSDFAKFLVEVAGKLEDGEVAF